MFIKRSERITGTEHEMWLNIKEEIYKATCKARLIQASDDARQKLLDENIKKIVNEHQIDYSIISVQSLIR